MQSIFKKLSFIIAATFLISACQTATYVQDQPMKLSHGAANHFVKFLEDKQSGEFYTDILGVYATYYY